MVNKGMLRQVQQMQAKIAKAQEELEKVTVEASAGGGAVTVIVSGQQKLCSVKINPEVVEPEDVEMLEDLVLAAVNEGLDKAKEIAAQSLGKVTGINIPGLM